MVYGVVYLSRNTVNGRLYIGQSKQSKSKFNSYYGSGMLIKQAIKKYGKSNFTKEILEECSSSTELDNAEIYWIDYFGGPKNKALYNIYHGGQGFRNYHKENNPFHGKKHSQETKEKISKANKGKVRTTQEKINNSIRNTGENNARYGVKLSQEFKNMLSDIKKGKPIKKRVNINEYDIHKMHMYGMSFKEIGDYFDIFYGTIYYRYRKSIGAI